MGMVGLQQQHQQQQQLQQQQQQQQPQQKHGKRRSWHIMPNKVSAHIEQQEKEKTRHKCGGRSAGDGEGLTLGLIYFRRRIT